MVLSRGLLAGLVSVCLLVACSTPQPRFQTVYGYVPPGDAAGLACLDACEKGLWGCREECQRTWLRCSRQVESQVNDAYAAALGACGQELGRYRRELDSYNWHLWMGWGHRHGGFWYDPWPAPWYEPVYRPVPPPDAPTRETTAFADFDNRQLLAVDNPNLLLFSRTDPNNSRNRVLVVGNFNVAPQALPVDALRSHGFFLTDGMKDLCTGERFEVENDAVVLHPLSCHWLVD